MGHQHDENCKCKSTVAAQSLDEMDFERGIWSAGMIVIEIKKDFHNLNSLNFHHTNSSLQ